MFSVRSGVRATSGDACGTVPHTLLAPRTWSKVASRSPSWSEEMLLALGNETVLVINALIYVEVSAGFERIKAPKFCSKASTRSMAPVDS